MKCEPIPRKPLVQLISNPAAVQRWLSTMFDAGGAAIQAWLRHFAGLFRSVLPAAPVVQRAPDPDNRELR